MTSDHERQSRRKAFEAIGPEQLRLRLEHRRAEYGDAYSREAEVWLLEQDAKKAAIELNRFRKVLTWAIVAGVASVVAAIAGLIGAWPVVREWIR
ncbi:hypothetical protein [Bradyrhizobium sp.]|uniref:hypothetical protein n=1 Tax=Bradyrhizobium sp. TaxID=376 RepID=UPI002602B0CD|nr:hypothetical protein [Bradyrhizobium sp.]